MRGIPWKHQIAEGRVFELRSTSKRYPAPCALVINADAKSYGSKHVVGVDMMGVIGDGLYHRRRNPDIYVDGLRGKYLTSRIVRRRRDLERFDREDLALIRYGCALDFDGRITTESLPTVVPSSWAVFWIPAFGQHDYFWGPQEARGLLRGAWYMENHGGARHLGYKYGYMWATRHTGKRLEQIRRFLRNLRGDLIEQSAQVARWSEGDRIITAEIRRECPALGMTSMTIESADGVYGYYR